jgi:D-alanine--poly(phosphoribitol) ligase subunit 2
LNQQEIKSIIVAALNEVLLEHGTEAVDAHDDAHLFGEGSLIDSLDLVTIVVQIEETIQERTGITIEVVDENSVIGGNSPFRTVGTLASMIKDKLDAE